MPGDAKATHPNGLEITFTEHDHRYIDANGQHYKSGTAVVSLVKPPFDPTGQITANFARKHGKSVDQVKAEWKAKGDASCEYGTRVHEYAEGLLMGKPELLHQPREQREVTAFVAVQSAVKYIHDCYTFLTCEQIVFSPALGIAGSIDLLLADPVSKTLIVGDWKTNEEIERISQYGNKMLPPLEHMDHCNFIHYTLQLGLYAYLIEREGYLASNGMAGWKVQRMIIHIPPGMTSARWLNCPPLEIEVRDMVIERLTDVPF